ncbi:hypothetical protein E8E12_004527 [Didymella heteroderae]|uniref:Uncharacterized protein n=1 Tax=Didymella heteroderae TaxID=1769908 RepID=A0A9P4WPE1_9PLEO|nr:hypothetical protein E8E12_004527 [Didymella heteroderae]
MENKADDEARRKWEQEAKAKAEGMQEAGAPSRKRPRAIGFPKTQEGHMQQPSFDSLLDGTAGKDRNALSTKAGASNTPLGAAKATAPRAAVTRAKCRTLFSEEDESRVEELD